MPIFTTLWRPKVNVSLFILTCLARVSITFAAIALRRTLLDFPKGFMAMFYFVGIKFPLSGLLSSAVLLLLIISIQLLATGVTGHDFFQGLHQEFMNHFHIGGASSIGFLVAGIGLLYLTIVFMHLFARILRLATKYSLCEYFATVGVVVRDDSSLLHPLLVEPNGELVPHDVVVTPLGTISQNA
ncbi:hypothetical protein LEN26_020726 [Aphanomyces euteiches]|nr:hypothetical protein LEN26_020726 [Aphanomyces euteiches]KAH9121235.1 hypothetical protein AeMF1_006947 [Aphanomyces euteiches]KAH9182142.1 hypothetical protein AeNC1_015883 [Aphanomyces euteiches]